MVSHGAATAATRTAGLLVLVVIRSVVAGKYNTGAEPVTGKLNVHFVAHSHDDVGWLKTVDQYYEASVRDILTTVTTELEANSDRIYNQVETAFFARWWREQSEDKKARVKKLIADGQLDFINGGWCMHDEAATHYLDMIDQTTFGHLYLKRELGVIPKHGWQIDPFGHSAVQAYLLGAELGFESMYAARIDYQEKKVRHADKTLEMIWRASDTLGSTADIFYGVFPVHYSPPDTFDLEPRDQDYFPVQDDESIEGYNVDERVDELVQAATTQAALTRTEHIMWTMGNDFTYQNAVTWFENMDKLIHYANLDGRVNVFYSNPSKYLEAKMAANQSWPMKTGDFFPYADSALTFWTGYFTSRAALKGYVRKLSGFLQAAKQLEFCVGRSATHSTDLLQDAMATVQHHDGAEAVVNSALGCLSSGADCKSNSRDATIKQCPFLNITYCAASEAPLHAQKLVVVAYNPLAWARTEYVRLVVTHTRLAVLDSSGKEIVSQIIPVTVVERKVRSFYVEAELGIKTSDRDLYWLVFEASVPPLGYTSYVVQPSEEGAAEISKPEILELEKSGLKPKAVKAGGENMNLLFSSESGRLLEMVHLKTKTSTFVRQSNMYYVADAGEDGQASGAYIFRPADDTPRPMTKSAEVPRTTFFRGAVVDEVHQIISPWFSQVGPVPVDGEGGKEVIARFDTSIKSERNVFTDSNGRDFIKRVRNHRDDWNLEVTQPVAGNYYPINLGLYITDGAKDFSLLVDRAVGGASIKDGSLEIMLHRSLVNDDGRGVGEALNERVCVGQTCEGLTVKGKYYISVMLKENASEWRRSFGQRVYSPLQLAFTEQLGNRSTFSALTGNFSLPANVALLTLQELEGGDVLLRLGHLYQAGEHAKHSKAASVDLKNMFKDRKIVTATELNLSGNQLKSVLKKNSWRVQDGISTSSMVARGSTFDANTMIVELGPMEIRTFQLAF
ncbi:hypothetical protein AXG93_857s1150 [Marchantia polymorpha subsp. ruderalis]|uniref:Alpha-mannosidase n=1 Tax=Marchantia polymorpha subsp. ruderalis TaxID=1480154 RepID=A0A176WEN1_MARPO|nr:hypothetical protein AXG93_857s1150 [Marchantia polymorpha subsp. ruderalis]